MTGWRGWRRICGLRHCSIKYSTPKVVDAYALAVGSTSVHQQGVLTYKLYAILRGTEVESTPRVHDVELVDAYALLWQTVNHPSARGRTLWRVHCTY